MDKEQLLKKHAFGLECARKYWVLSQPTGISDVEFDKLELEARLDGLELRDEVFKELVGTRSPNANYITPVGKIKAKGKLYDSLKEFINSWTGGKLLWSPKYDGSSIVAYFNEDGECNRVVTAGGTNRSGEGIDQTWKLRKYFPKLNPDYRIMAIQCECLVDLNDYFDRARQKANGLVNSKDMEDEVERLICIRGFRYFITPDSSFNTSEINYHDVLDEDIIPRVSNSYGIKFSMAQAFTNEELLNIDPEIINGDELPTNTGKFNFDGFVAYDSKGNLVTAIKSHDGGKQESTVIKCMRWNNQLPKGKDGWSLNVELNPPVEVKGSLVRKPSSGGVPRALKEGLSVGALVTVCLSGSTIPYVEVITPGNGDMQYPTCSCGYAMSDKDIFGSNLKCGNNNCNERLERMYEYLKDCESIDKVDYNRLFIIDRFDFNKKILDRSEFDSKVINIISNDYGYESLRDLVLILGLSKLQEKNLNLVVRPAYRALRMRFL